MRIFLQSFDCLFVNIIINIYINISTVFCQKFNFVVFNILNTPFLYILHNFHLNLLFSALKSTFSYIFPPLFNINIYINFYIFIKSVIPPGSAPGIKTTGSQKIQYHFSENRPFP